MAKQTFTTGQVLLASQLTSLQQTAMLGGAASNKTSSYTLVSADAGTAISMTSTSATTITVNTGLFAAGDTVQITNLGAGVCTITAGTATVNTSATLALAQYESGTLDFTTTSAAIFVKGATAAAGGSGGPAFAVYGSTAQSGIANATFTKAALNTEVFDTDNCYDTTLYRFTPNKSGYYQINTNIERTVTSISFAIIALYKNGAQYNRVHLSDSGVNFTANCATLVYLNGTTDYIEWFVYLDGGTRNIQNDADQITTGVWIRS